jgi:hypothetical protein
MEQFLALTERIFLQLFASVRALVSVVRRFTSFLLDVADDHHVSCRLQTFDAEAEDEDRAEGRTPGVFGPRTEGAF